MVRVEDQRENWFGVLLAAAGGLAAGLAVGVMVGEMLGDMSSRRWKDAFKGMGPTRARTPSDPRMLRRAVMAALQEHEDVGDLNIDVTAHEDGIVELTGVATDPILRELAGEVARDVPGADVVVNRVLVEGTDISSSAR